VRTSALGLLLLVAHTAACAYDFHDFDPVSDASPRDGKSPPADARDETRGVADAAADVASDARPSDAVVDVGDVGETGSCVPPPACLTQATSCASSCAATESSCASALTCSVNPACVKKCKAAETSCSEGCAASCTVCTADGGCLDVSGCTGASS
jgi:hypothetical protein